MIERVSGLRSEVDVRKRISFGLSEMFAMPPAWIFVKTVSGLTKRSVELHCSGLAPSISLDDYRIKKRLHISSLVIQECVR